MIFQNRQEAGRLLAARLEEYRGTDAIVLALPRGGVVVGHEIAKALGLPLDVIITRKVGAPGNPEYAIGAVSETGEVQLNREEIAYFGIPSTYVEEEVARQRVEITRQARLYRGSRGLPDVAGRHVLVVDDGIATGFTMFATLRALKAQRPSQLVVAVPVGPPPTIDTLAKEVDKVVCLATPEPFIAVGAWYRHFDQIGDDEVRSYLEALGGPSLRA